MQKKFNLMMLLLLFIFSGLSAQNNDTIKGKVMDDATRELMEGVPVKINGQVVYSDKKGEFIFPAAGKKARIIIQISGYEKYEKELIAPFSIQTVELKLADNFTMDKIVVKDRKKTNEGSKQKLKSEQIKRTTTHLFSDSLKVVQTLPGVTTGNDFASLLYIRGGDYYESVSFLDNALVVAPYIWGGMQSIFNPSFVDSLDFYSGGFPVKYPQSLSGVIDVKNIEGDYKKTSGFIELSAASIEGFIQGPISKDKSSYIVGLRRTQYDLVAKLFSDNKDIVYPFFYDAQSKFSWKVNKKNKLFLNFITSYEGMNFDLDEEEGRAGNEEAEFHYRDLRALPTFNWEYNASKNLLNGLTVQYRNQRGYYDFYGPNKTYFEVEENAQEVFLRNRVNFISDRHNIEQGIFNYTTWVSWEERSRERSLMPDGTYITNNDKEGADWKPFTCYGLYLQDDLAIRKDLLYINGGILYDVFTYTSDQVVSPRGGVRVLITRTTTWKFNTGLYSQYPFYSPDGHGEPPFGANKKIKAEKAIHYITGIEQEMYRDYTVKVEVYQKDYYDRIVKDPDLGYSNKGKRKVYGFDLLFQKKVTGDFDGWISYSYIKAEDKIISRSDPADFNESGLEYLEPVGEWFIYKKERKHNFSLVANYDFTAVWKIAVTYRFASGMPYTPVKGAVHYGGDTYVPQYGKYLSGRLPDFSRLDIKLTMPGFTRNMESFIQSINTLNHNNIDSYYYSEDYTEKKSASMLPFLIIGGIRYNF